MSTTTPSAPPSPFPPRRRPTALAARRTGLLLTATAVIAMTACSPSHGRTAVGSSSPATTAPAPTPAPTTAPTPAPVPDDGGRALLTGILATHHAAGDFVGARIARRGRDGTITEATAGTVGVDPASGPVDPGVAWNIGSITKTFVAVVVLQLADEGRLDLDGGIARFFPALAQADRITPRQLLQHTSGLGEYEDQPAVVADRQRRWAPAELIAAAEAGGRVGQPGGPHHYANTNYIVLGEIIERVTGHPWADEVRTRIVERLHLTGTSIEDGQLPVGYQVVDGAFVDTTSTEDPSIGGAAGALQSTDRDLLAFAVALADGTLLSQDASRAMRAFVPGDDYSQFGIDHGYGLGLERYATGATTIIGHMGTGNAQSAFFGYDAEHGTAVAVMTNTAVPGPQAIMAVEALTAPGPAR